MARASTSSSKGKQKEVDVAVTPEVAAAEKGSKSGSEPKVKKPEKIKLRRIHVSGLPDITEQDARDRFKSFGEVVGVDGLGKLDATGKPLRYAFIDIKATKSKLAQCMNLLSGSVWKGSTLRIAEAKPTILEKLEQERKQVAKQQASESSTSKKDKKRKRSEDDEGGDEKLVNATNVKSKSGWKLDPQTQTPIFPVVMRPDHPLPPPVVKEVVAGPSSEAKKEDKSKKKDKKAEKAAAKKAKKKEAEKPKEVSLSPPNRARLVKIDPTQWQPKHLREEDLENLPDTSAVKTKHVKAKKAEKSAKKVVKAPTPPPVSESSETSEEDTSSEEDASETTSQKPTAKPEAAAPIKIAKAKTAAEIAYDEQASLAERQANLDLVAKLLGGLPKDLAPVQEAVSMQLDEADSSPSEDESTDKDSGTQVEVPASLAPKTMAAAATLASQAVQTTPNSDDAMHSDNANSATLEQQESVPLETTAAEESMDDSEDEEEVQEDLVDASKALAADKTTSQDSEESTESNVEVPAPAPRLVEVQMQSLTEMFKPQEAAEGFSLGDLLNDFEVDELEDEVPAPIIRTGARQTFQDSRPAWSAPAYAATPIRQPAASTSLFFPFPLDEDERPGGLLSTMDQEERERLLERSWTGTSNVRRFKRTQNIDEITTHYDSVRRNISEQVRKRHREAVKRQKKHGGKRTAQLVSEEQ